MKPNLKYYKIYPEAKAPIFATENAACFDICAHLVPDSSVKLYSSSNKQITTKVGSDGVLTIRPGDRVLVPSGIIFDIPDNHSVRLHIRSSVAYKLGMNLANDEAVIDDDYYHETFILLYNMSDQSVKIASGDRIAQGELVPKYQYDISERDAAPEQKTDRVGGVGSTGRN